MSTVATRQAAARARTHRHVAYAVIALLALVSAFAFGWLSFGSVALANAPALTGRVVDEADVLDPGFRAVLASKLKSLEEQTTDQLVVATVKSLGGHTIEDYANQLFRKWQLGQKDKNNGVLLLVAPVDRKVRIEVGYGLEGELPDAVAKLIVQDRMIPDFRSGNYTTAIARGTDSIIDVLTGGAPRWKQDAARYFEPAPRTPFWRSDTGTHLIIAITVIGIFVLLRLVVPMSPTDDRRLRPARASRGRRSSRDDGGGSSSSSSWSSSDSSSSSSDSFSGGGGSSGGGGASGSW